MNFYYCPNCPSICETVRDSNRVLCLGSCGWFDGNYARSVWYSREELRQLVDKSIPDEGDYVA